MSFSKSSFNWLGNLLTIWCRPNFRELSDLLRRLEALLRNSIPSYFGKAPLIYEDALLRKFALDLDFIPSCMTITPLSFLELAETSSDDIFIHVVNQHYKGTNGELKIRNQEYIFEDKNQKPLNLAGVWGSDILSGKCVFMRVLFDEDNASKSQQCPSCRSINEGACTQSEIIWSVFL